MEPFTRRSETFGSSAFPDAHSELRWEESALWPARRPYPLEIPCPACGAYTRCGLFGRGRCPLGHEFGQRAFWSGGATNCALLLEDLRDGRMLVYPELGLRWRDDARQVVS